MEKLKGALDRLELTEKELQRETVSNELFNELRYFGVDLGFGFKRTPNMIFFRSSPISYIDPSTFKRLHEYSGIFSHINPFNGEVEYFYSDGHEFRIIYNFQVANTYNMDSTEDA